MIQELLTAIGFADHFVGLRQHFKQLQTVKAQREARRALGAVMVDRWALPVEQATALWDEQFRRSAVLATQFDEAATLSGYLAVFRAGLH